MWIINKKTLGLHGLQICKDAKDEGGGPGVLGIQELKRKKKYDGGLHSEYEGLVELLQQLSLSFLVGRKSGLTGTELLRDPKTNIKDYQQNRRRGTERDLKASGCEKSRLRTAIVEMYLGRDEPGMGGGK
ncbi:Hypothetical predicted protein [Podarcis lilfordi]|uniref:Uncharacterized protein n=1 Tax=Podarcis lilfordi TaxID=74358 RepID=A0AA35KLW0_9SAUR|nr:Hypothetical predicted protein [Podarcis lilfordi]